MQIIDKDGNPTDPFPHDEHGNMLSLPRVMMFNFIVNESQKQIGVMAFLYHDAQGATVYTEQEVRVRAVDGQERDQTMKTLQFGLSRDQAQELGKELLAMASSM